MSTILALETATEACSVALLIDNRLYERFVVAPRQHAELILMMIDALLTEADIALTAVDAFAFGCGPGSFMGVRIAAGVVQGLAFGVQRPVIPISTLQALAQTAYRETQARQIMAGLDAHGGGIYWGAYRFNPAGFMEAVLHDRFSTVSASTTALFPSEGGWLSVGDAWAVMSPLAGSQVKCDSYPHAGAVATIAAEQYQLGIRLPPEQALPMYLHDPHVK